MRPVRLKRAAYHCYVVADLTPTLRREILPLSLRATPDDAGRFGYVGSGEDAFYLEIVPYEKLLSDAKLRNAIFFQKLGLTDLDPVVPALEPVDDEADDADAEALQES